MNNFYWATTPKNVKAVVTTRNGGYSLGNFSSFNLAQHVGDDPKAVTLNRQKLVSDLNLPSEPYWLNQCHSNKALEIKNDKIYNADDLTVDASFTREKQVVCCVLTADCLPILLCDRFGTIVASIHAGWKGLASGVIENTLRSMAVNCQDIIAWFGPAIGSKEFVVGDDVYETFVDKIFSNVNAFRRAIREESIGAKKGHKWFADIYLLAFNELVNCGVFPHNIHKKNFCTASQKDEFFSYRRDNGTTGRMASLIWLTE